MSQFDVKLEKPHAKSTHVSEGILKRLAQSAKKIAKVAVVGGSLAITPALETPKHTGVFAQEEKIATGYNLSYDEERAKLQAIRENVLIGLKYIEFGEYDPSLGLYKAADQYPQCLKGEVRRYEATKAELLADLDQLDSLTEQKHSGLLSPASYSTESEKLRRSMSRKFDVLLEIKTKTRQAPTLHAKGIC